MPKYFVKKVKGVRTAHLCNNDLLKHDIRHGFINTTLNINYDLTMNMLNEDYKNILTNSDM